MPAALTGTGNLSKGLLKITDGKTIATKRFVKQ